LILGGHTHTFLEKPTVLLNQNKQQVIINQVGWAGVNLGRIDIDVESKLFGSKNIEVV
jgi:5'-nucleotidase